MGPSGGTLQGPTHLPPSVGIPTKASPSHHASMVAAAAAVAAVAVVSWQLVEMVECLNVEIRTCVCVCVYEIRTSLCVYVV